LFSHTYPPSAIAYATIFGALTDSVSLPPGLITVNFISVPSTNLVASSADDVSFEVTLIAPPPDDAAAASLAASAAA